MLHRDQRGCGDVVDRVVMAGVGGEDWRLSAVPVAGPGSGNGAAVETLMPGGRR